MKSKFPKITFVSAKISQAGYGFYQITARFKATKCVEWVWMLFNPVSHDDSNLANPKKLLIHVRSMLRFATARWCQKNFVLATDKRWLAELYEQPGVLAELERATQAASELLTQIPSMHNDLMAKRFADKMRYFMLKAMKSGISDDRILEIFHNCQVRHTMQT